MKLLEYDSQTHQVTMPGAVALPKYVNGITVKNSGTVDLYWDQDKIVAGDFKALGGNLGEIYKGRLSLRWKVQSPAPSPAIQMATVTIKFYVNREV